MITGLPVAALSRASRASFTPSLIISTVRSPSPATSNICRPVEKVLVITISAPARI